MNTLAFLCLLALSTFLISLANAQAVSQVEDPFLKKKLPCGVMCYERDLAKEKNMPADDCYYDCISPLCYRKVMKPLFGKNGFISREVTLTRDKKFNRCAKFHMYQAEVARLDREEKKMK